jgi:DNA-binding transcriptional LysR family regulator
MLEAAAQPLERQLLSARIDFALTAAPQPRAEFSFTPWMRDPLVLLCARTHAFAKRKAVQWRMLAGQTLIDFSPRSSIQPLIDGTLAPLGLEVEHLTSSSIATCCAMVAEDMGVAIVPQLALELCGVRAFERVCAIPLREPVVPRAVGVLQLAGRTLSPACTRFMDELKSQLATQLAELRGPWQLPAR